MHHRDFRYYHEEMAPVFDSPYCKADEAYGAFLSGVTELGQAMACQPYLGELPKQPRSVYGAFWSQSHV
jgi:hypothetical protein